MRSIEEMKGISRQHKADQKFLENSKNLLGAWISGSEERFKEFMGRLSQQEIMFLRELMESLGAELYNELSPANRQELERRLIGGFELPVTPMGNGYGMLQTGTELVMRGGEDEQIREVSNSPEAEPTVEEGREA